MHRVREWLEKAKQAFRAAAGGWSAFMERQGFYVMLGVCVAVIIGTAVYTRGRQTPLTPPPEEAPNTAPVDNAADFVQRISDVTWVTAAPTAAPTEPPVQQTLQQGLADVPKLTWPTKGTLLRGYDQAQPVYWNTLGAWAVHEGIDVAAEAGEPVVAAMSGTVSAAYNDMLSGNVIEVQHPGGWVTRYCGLSTLEMLRVGDPVKAGQTLSALGGSLPLEADDPPHLHFELLRDGEWMNPEDYLEDIAKDT